MSENTLIDAIQAAWDKHPFLTIIIFIIAIIVFVVAVNVIQRIWG